MERKTDDGQESAPPAFDIFSRPTLNPLRAFSAYLGEKTRLLCNSDHELIGIVEVCPSVFSVPGLSFSFFEQSWLIFIYSK
jgi:hypothetical protein